MQLKLQRTQRAGGMIAKSVLFCLDARVQFSAEESANIKRYKLQDQLIYSSEAATKAATGSMAAAANARAGRVAVSNVDDLLSSTASKMGHGLKAAALGALASMKLTVTISSLERGQHIECKNLDELLAAEDAIMDACRSLKGYLEMAATFDGREVLIDFSDREPTVVASAPAPMLVGVPSFTSPAPEAATTTAPTATPALQDSRSTPVSHLGSGESAAERLLRGFNAMSSEQLRAIVFVALGVVLLLIILAIIF